MDSGKLVPDDLVNQMVAERLEKPDTARGYILDGYPRTLAQAEWLDGRLAGAAGLPLIAVSIQVSYTQLLRRITGRRNCPTCQRIYNVYLQPPKFDTVCDVEGTPLVQRADDVEDGFPRADAHLRGADGAGGGTLSCQQPVCGSGWRAAGSRGNGGHHGRCSAAPVADLEERVEQANGHHDQDAAGD